MAEKPEQQKSKPGDGKGRLLLISNRLPITISRTEEGEFNFKMSSGGLVSGLEGLKKTTEFVWYGWPGIQVPENEIEKLETQLKEEHNAVPVFLDDDLADKHYNGFSSMLAG
jgi:trehalose 6-phosphate synthase